ncbi:MAG TPA: STAS domain-containing protein [Spirochaetota bacterium]|nr:STAS domain-containing protein [Spirochaetota bacterium]
MDNNKILIGSIDNNIYLKAIGHITANLCFPMREDLFKKISLMKSKINIFFDLSETTYMDSTFIGLLVGIDKKLKNTFNNNLLIVKPTEIVIELLSKMNLINFLKRSEEKLPDDINYSVFDETIDISEIEKTKIILIAHKDLSSISIENKKKFKSLTDILEKQIQEK